MAPVTVIPWVFRLRSAFDLSREILNIDATGLNSINEPAPFSALRGSKYPPSWNGLDRGDEDRDIPTDPLLQRCSKPLTSHLGDHQTQLFHGPEDIAVH